LSWISRDFECSACGTRFDRIVRRSEDNGETTCECGGTAKKILSIPKGMHTAMQDGVDRGDAYRKLKEAARLDKEMVNLPHDQRGDHQKQIAELKKLK